MQKDIIEDRISAYIAAQNLIEEYFNQVVEKKNEI